MPNNNKRRISNLIGGAIALVVASGGTFFLVQHADPQGAELSNQSAAPKASGATPLPTCAIETGSLTEAERRLKAAQESTPAATSSLDELRSGTGITGLSYEVAQKRRALQDCEHTR